MEDTLEVLANVPKAFAINGAKYQVRRFTMFDLAAVRREIVDGIKLDRRADYMAMAKELRPEDKPRFLGDAVKSMTVTEEEITSGITSERGLMVVLARALRKSIEVVKAMMDDPELTHILTEIFEWALDIRKSEVTVEVVGADSPK